MSHAMLRREPMPSLRKRAERQVARRSPLAVRDAMPKEAE
jgi:hypothetical protein